MVSSVKKMAYDCPTGKEQKLRPSWNWFHFSLASNLMTCALAWRTLGSWRCWWNFLEFRGVIKIAKTGINHCKYIVILIDLRMKKLLLWLVMQSDIMTFVSQSFKKLTEHVWRVLFGCDSLEVFFWGGRKESKVYRSQHSLTKNVYFVSIKTGQVPSIPNWTIGESSNLPHATDVLVTAENPQSATSLSFYGQAHQVEMKSWIFLQNKKQTILMKWNVSLNGLLLNGTMVYTILLPEKIGIGCG